jgi:hypothetical protein
MSEIIEFNRDPARMRQIIESAGQKIGSVHFIKRSDGSLRKMCYRLHVKKPSVAPVPNGLKNAVAGDGNDLDVADLTARKKFDEDHNQITVLDANKVVRDSSGKKIGRGAWRTIPLDAIQRITVNGKTYKITDPA